MSINNIDNDIFFYSRDDTFDDINVEEMDSNSSAESLTQTFNDFIDFSCKVEPASVPELYCDPSYEQNSDQSSNLPENIDNSQGEVSATTSKTVNVNKYKQKKHFSGKIDCSKYQENSRERAKSKLVRRNTIFKKAKEISTLCNVEVAVIFLDNKGLKTYYSNEDLETKLQPVLDDALKGDIVSKRKQ